MRTHLLNNDTVNKRETVRKSVGWIMNDENEGCKKSIYCSRMKDANWKCGIVWEWKGSRWGCNWDPDETAEKKCKNQKNCHHNLLKQLWKNF